MLPHLITFLFSTALADDSHVPKTTTHTVQIPYGSILDDKNNPYAFMRKIETDKMDCSGFDIGCGFVLTAGHCDTVGAKIKTGVNADKEVGRVVDTYIPPGMPVPRNDDGWIEGENANADIKLLRVDYGDNTPKAAPERIKWDLAPTVVDPAKPQLGFIAGYGSTTAKWNEKKGHWEPEGPGNKLACGRVPYSYSGLFTGQHGADRWKENFAAHRADKRGRICAEPTPGLQTIIQGDSGGPLVHPNGYFGGIISSMWRSRAPRDPKKNEPNYLSCFVDLAGHLSWIYATMKPFCSSLPPVEAFAQATPGDRLGAVRPALPPGVPERLPDPVIQRPPRPPVPPELRVLEPPVAPGRPDRLPPSLPPSQPPPAAEPAPAAPSPNATARDVHTILHAFRRQQAQARTPRYELPDMDGPTRERLRDAVGLLVQTPRHHQIGFSKTLRVGRDGVMELPFAFCPLGQPIAKCEFVQAGTVRVTAQAVEVRLDGLPPRSFPLR